MDTIAVSLGISVLVVLVLLTSCWTGPKGRRQAPCRDTGAAILARQRAANAAADEGQFDSDWGTGVKNRQMAAQYQELQNLTGYDDYGQVTQMASLEPDVFSSHEEYTKDINRSTSGASNMAVRSDPNDVVSWVGLRRPNYSSTYPASDARITSSESVDQMPSQTRYLI